MTRFSVQFQLPTMADDMSLEINRRVSFTHVYSDSYKPIAKAGFFEDASTGKIKCFACSLEFNKYFFFDPMRFHVKHSPDCFFVTRYLLEKARGTRSKIFKSLVMHLLYERERLDTFIEWPLKYISPEDLAKEGFYYLRKNDHCACIFCARIIGEWEFGDTPRQEHLKHEPSCPSFSLNTPPVGNDISLANNAILDKLVLKGEERPVVPTMKNYLWRTPTWEYIHEENRLRTFSQGNKWPAKRVAQNPVLLAQAGFYYCGIGDYVRCSSCTLGLHNWEIDDNPWILHAHYSPDCLFLKYKEDIKFITKSDNVGGYNAKKPSSGRFKTIDENDLETLMNSLRVMIDIRSSLSLKFSYYDIKDTLRKKLKQTGIPFLTVDEGINAITQRQKQNQQKLEIIEKLPILTLVEFQRQQQQQQQEEPTITTTTTDLDSCIICLEAKREIIMFPCKHLLSCASCTSKIITCPCCRAEIESVLRVYLS